MYDNCNELIVDKENVLASLRELSDEELKDTRGVIICYVYCYCKNMKSIIMNDYT